MKSTSSRLFSLFITGLLGMSLSIDSAHADYLIRPVRCPEPEYVGPCYVPHVIKCHVNKRHIVKKRKPCPRRHYRCYRPCAPCSPCGYRPTVPVCAYPYHPQADIPSFRRGAPTGYGCYVNLNECEPYDPDMSTGDDDPTVYPGMNINN